MNESPSFHLRARRGGGGTRRPRPHRAREDGVGARLAGTRPSLRKEMDEFAGTKFGSLECGATLCRVAGEHASSEAMSAFARKASKYPPFYTQVFHSYGEPVNGPHPPAPAPGPGAEEAAGGCVRFGPGPVETFHEARVVFSPN